MRALLAWFEAEGSTRPAALLRIGFAAILWVKFGDAVGYHVAVGWFGVLLGSFFFLVTGMLFVGLYTRIAAALTALLLGFMYFGFGLGGGAAEWAHHHVYLLVAVAALLALSHSGRSLSLDRWRALARGDAGPERGSLVAMRLIALQVAAVYLWGAVDKTDWAWISGERLQQVFWWHYEGRALFDVLTPEPVPAILSVAVLVVEYAIAPAILIRRTQPFAVPLALALHAAFYLLLPVRVFSATMMLCYLAVIDADATDRVLDRLLGRRTAAGP